MSLKPLKSAYEVPVIEPTRRKLVWSQRLQKKYTKLVRWYLSVFWNEGMDFRGTSLNHARKLAKELTYSTKRRRSKYNCKGAVAMPHSHYYDTAMLDAISLWKSFLTWKEKRARRGKTTKKTMPMVKGMQPKLDTTMFSLEIGRPGERGWITLKTSRGMEEGHLPLRVPNKKRYEGLDTGRITSVQLRAKGSKLTFKLIQTEESRYEEADLPLGDQEGLLVKAFDLGERNLACSVSITPGPQPTGMKVQRVRIHSGSGLRNVAYREFHIRRKLQKQGKASEIPKRKYREANLRMEECRRIVLEETRDIEEYLVRGVPVLVAIGDLRAPAPSKRGVLSRRLNEYPRGTLREMLVHRLRKLGLRYYEYPRKLKDFGHPGAVVLIPENGSSKECHCCGHDGVRHSQALFECTNPDCEVFLYNADVSASLSICGRAVRLPAIGGSMELGAVPRARGGVTPPGRLAREGVQQPT